MSSNAGRYDLFELDADGVGKPGGSYTSISKAEAAAVRRARQLAERPGCEGHRVVVVDREGTTIATVLVTAMRSAA